MAVGYNNVDVDAATKYGVAVGNTPVSLIILHHVLWGNTYCFQFGRLDKSNFNDKTTVTHSSSKKLDFITSNGSLF